MKTRMRGRRFFAVLFAVLLCAMSLNLSALAEGETGAADQVVIQVVHTNDIHGRSSYAADQTVGFEKLKTYVEEQKADLLVDVGDLFHGQAFATLEQGASIAELVKAVGYDAITPGNHDWNYGKEQLLKRTALSGAKMLAANVTQGGQNFFSNDGTLVKTVDGVKIGVLGVFDQDIKSDTAPRNIEGLDFADDAQTANELAAKLREEGCDIVVALSHQLYCEEFIGRTRGIDVLIAGHEHMALDASYTDADGKAVKVVETGCYFQNAGCLSITYDTNQEKIVSMEESLLTAGDAQGLAPDEAVSGLLEEIHAKQAQKLTEVVGTTGLELDGRWENLRIEETGMGRLVTAAYLKETGADIAFENAGGIRLGRLVPAGNITYQDVIDTSPFGNYIVTKQITGSAVKAILEKSIDIGIRNKASYDEWIQTGSDQTRWPDDNGSYLQFGGLTASYNPEKPAGERVVSVEIKGEPLNQEKLYTIATNNYIGLGGAYGELKEVPELNQYSACDEALIAFIRDGQETVDTAVSTVGIQIAKTPDVPDIPDVPEPSDVPDKGKNEGGTPVKVNGKSPQTGEEAPEALAGIALISGIAVCVLFMKARKQQV